MSFNFIQFVFSLEIFRSGQNQSYQKAAGHLRFLTQAQLFLKYSLFNCRNLVFKTPLDTTLLRSSTMFPLDSTSQQTRFLWQLIQRAYSLAKPLLSKSKYISFSTIVPNRTLFNNADSWESDVFNSCWSTRPKHPSNDGLPYFALTPYFKKSSDRVENTFSYLIAKFATELLIVFRRSTCCHYMCSCVPKSVALLRKRENVLLYN